MYAQRTYVIPSRLRLRCQSDHMSDLGSCQLAYSNGAMVHRPRLAISQGDHIILNDAKARSIWATSARKDDEEMDYTVYKPVSPSDASLFTSLLPASRYHPPHIARAPARRYPSALTFLSSSLHHSPCPPPRLPLRYHGIPILTSS